MSELTAKEITAELANGVRRMTRAFDAAAYATWKTSISIERFSRWATKALYPTWPWHKRLRVRHRLAWREFRKGNGYCSPDWLWQEAKRNE